MAESFRCDLCGTWRARPGQCLQIACLACGAVQCHAYGLARGCCHVCHFGRLPGWSFSWRPATCQFKGCTEPCVYAYLPGSKHDCCKAHGLAIIARLGERRERRQAARRP
jgi:hypothetical protein